MSSVEKKELKFASKSLLMPSQVILFPYIYSAHIFEWLKYFNQFAAASKNWLLDNEWQMVYEEV